MGKSSSYIEEDFPKISASSYVENVVFSAVLVMTCQNHYFFFDVDTKIAQKGHFFCIQGGSGFKTVHNPGLTCWTPKMAKI